MTKIELNKACEWLDTHILCMHDETRKYFIGQFHKAMEEISGNKEEIPSNWQSMSNDKAIDILTHWADGLWMDKHGITNGDFDIAVGIACKALNPSNSCNSFKNLQELTWQDIAEIIVAYGYVPKLNKDGSVRPAEDVFKETLKKWDGGARQ